jgi:23S rRNA (cytosine1962-C5)-methyltransferase
MDADRISELKRENGYFLLDSGGFEKLELVGQHLISRPSPQALWLPSLEPAVWKKKEAWFVRNESGGGIWHTVPGSFPKEWNIAYNRFAWKVKCTPFGHTGLFAEHQSQMEWVRQQIEASGFPMEILNLFAYTGLATMTASRAGAKVCHVDAAKGIVAWARENAALSGMDSHPVRWIVDDVFHFIKNEIKRGKTYDGIILDPPSFGRGTRNELWKIEDHLIELLSTLKKLRSNRFKFLVLTSHTPSCSPLSLHNLLRDFFPGEGRMECGEMTIPQIDSPRALPSGAFARWSR